MFFKIMPYESATTWALYDGTPDKPGAPIFVSPGLYLSEEHARSAIAAVRKKAGGIKFAKVVSA